MGQTLNKPKVDETKSSSINQNLVQDKQQKPKPCCCCPETRRNRDECIVEKGEENCKSFIEAHREFQVMIEKRRQEFLNFERRAQSCCCQVISLDQHIKKGIDELNTFDRDPHLLSQACQSVRFKLKDCEEKLIELGELLKALPAGDLFDEIDMVIKRYRNEIPKNLVALRKACQFALKNVEAEQRIQLLTQSTETADGKFHSSKLSQQSAQFSDELSGLLSALDVQLKQSDDTLRTLVESSHMLSDTEQEFRSMGITISTSGKLLSKYGRREITDRILFVFALMFFFGVVFYILKKRLFPSP